VIGVHALRDDAKSAPKLRSAAARRINLLSYAECKTSPMRLLVDELLKTSKNQDRAAYTQDQMGRGNMVHCPWVGMAGMAEVGRVEPTCVEPAAENMPLHLPD
jgi:hypothetical protein